MNQLKKTGIKCEGCSIIKAMKESIEQLKKIDAEKDAIIQELRNKNRTALTEVCLN